MANLKNEDQQVDAIDDEVIANLDLLMQMDVVEEEESWNIFSDNEFSALQDEKKKE